MNNNIKYRLEFSKTDRMIFIGHLDLLKFLQRTMKRAKLPIGYSWGYNPHQLITFAIPLPLGMSSVGEIVDIQLTRRMDCDEIRDILNANLPEGISVLQVIELEFRAVSCAAAVAYADYCITLDKKYDNFDEIINKVLEKTEIYIERTVKKKTKTVDIRPLIRNICVDNTGDVTEFNCNIAAGSQGNLKPEVLLEYIYSLMGESLDMVRIDILRGTLYMEEEGVLLPLCLEEEFM